MSRTLSFIIFFSIVIVLYGLINTYIYLRGLQALPAASSLRQWFTVIFWFLALSYFAARLVEHFALSRISDCLVWIGSYWLGAMAYFVIILLALDIIRLVNVIVPFYPAFITQQYQHVKLMVACIVTALVVLTVVGGRLNQMYPRIKTLELSIHKKSPLKEVHIALVTDIHLGTIICNNHFTRIVEKINSLHPDIVLFAGDLVDEDIEPVIRENLGETLRQIQSRYGMYAVTGNHEYIGGVEPACKYLEDHGVVMLRDTVVTIADAFTLVGREDVSARQFGGRRRKPLEEVMNSVDRTLPVILMDHQPVHLQEAVDQGVDLQFSGHTHNGQLWPFNYIAQAVYEISWGYVRKGNTQFYVSCGVGTWGPPMRTGNTPEVVSVQLTFGHEGQEQKGNGG